MFTDKTAYPIAVCFPRTFDVVFCSKTSFTSDSKDTITP